MRGPDGPPHGGFSFDYRFDRLPELLSGAFDEDLTSYAALVSRFVKITRERLASDAIGASHDEASIVIDVHHIINYVRNAIPPLGLACLS